METFQKKQYVFDFDSGDGKNKKLLGGKGANLCEMTQIGLNVPSGFVITTEACLDYLNNNNTLPSGLMDEVESQLHALESKTGKSFGSNANPLLISVRSGSAVSMPGMMDTILNLGLNQHTLAGVIRQSNDIRFAYDSYRRFIHLFGKVALNLSDHIFDEIVKTVMEAAGITDENGLNEKALQDICEQFLSAVEEQTGRPFPEDPHQQLTLAIQAVFNSWLGKRAIDYRKQFKITQDIANGTAVNVMAMVFGNRGQTSATGVAFTRNPATGENKLFGEYLINAQGEDVVAGVRTPKNIELMQQDMPKLYDELQTLRGKLEQHYREIQDFEFTIEKGTLYCLQTRNGKLNATATVRSSVEMENEGILSRESALLRVEPEKLEQLLYSRLSDELDIAPVLTGLPASPGVAVGQAVFNADRAEKLGQHGEKVILIREETKPEDIHGFFGAQGILTCRGGKTSHAAVVARGMGKPCVVGAHAIHVDSKLDCAMVGTQMIKEGDYITIDGTTGAVYLGSLPTIDAKFTSELDTLLQWADEEASLRVMANADTPEDAMRALSFGAMGIGLCRTERMFNDPSRLPTVVEMIIADSKERRQEALSKLLPMQRQDFRALFEAMTPHEVTIRLLDPPIHEFLPSESQLKEEIEALYHLRKTVIGIKTLKEAYQYNISDASKTANTVPLSGLTQLDDLTAIDEHISKKEIMLKKVKSLREINPMLGHRGVRLGITFPEIYAMQIQAILEATAECMIAGIVVHPEILVPQVCTAQELKHVRSIVDNIQTEVENRYSLNVSFKFGTMIETVRACMRAGHLASQSHFFSFGTNDLTQATFSFSREDAENKFLPLYNETGILQDNPFEVLDTQGVGKLMELAVNWGKNSNPELKVGLCGEHGGHPKSIEFCHQLGLDYVSCSAPRIPIARLAAAHANIKYKH